MNLDPIFAPSRHAGLNIIHTASVVLVLGLAFFPCMRLTTFVLRAVEAVWFWRWDEFNPHEDVHVKRRRS